MCCESGFDLLAGNSIGNPGTRPHIDGRGNRLGARDGRGPMYREANRRIEQATAKMSRAATATHANQLASRPNCNIQATSSDADSIRAKRRPRRLLAEPFGQ